MPRLFLSRNVEDGNGRAGLVSRGRAGQQHDAPPPRCAGRFASWDRWTLTEMYRWHASSDHEIEDGSLESVHVD
jgi:hypothetical protein|eukprot:COSAG01_NODE_3622_length_5858_cov_1194.967187_5_plen_74_part_00